MSHPPVEAASVLLALTFGFIVAFVLLLFLGTFLLFIFVVTTSVRFVMEFVPEIAVVVFAMSLVIFLIALSVASPTSSRNVVIRPRTRRDGEFKTVIADKFFLMNFKGTEDNH
jgi:hypothetical protein